MSGVHLHGFAPGLPTLPKLAAVASCWQRVGDLIGSEFEHNPPAPEADVLPLVDK